MFSWLRVDDDTGVPRPILDSILLRLLGRQRIRKVRGAIPWNVRGPIEYCWWQVVTWVGFPVVRLSRFVARIKREERVLGIYNFWEQGGRIGDVIIFYQALNVVRAMVKLPWIDIAFIDDQNSPYYKKDPIRSQLEWKRSVMDMHSVIPRSGSIFYFNSDVEFEKFFKDNYHRYFCWPQYRKFHSWPSRINRRFVSTWLNTMPGRVTLIREHLAREGKLPHLCCPPEITDWALKFVEEKVSPSLPVVVHLRNSTFDQTRNSNIEAWGEFFRSQLTDDRFKFILIGHEQGIVPQFRELSNVFFSKDYGTTLEQDLALMQVAHMCLIHASGPGVFPEFTGIPFLKFVDASLQRSTREKQVIGLADDASIGCENEFQRLITEPETTEVLLTEFSRLVSELNQARWENPMKKHDSKSDETIY